ncbi:MAG: T9SS type A sorting domain-containing protein [Flavobacteriales bacterium]
MCDEMWNGVIASTITSSIFARGTSFQQGINALVSESGASLSTGSCTFFNDHKGIVVRNYTQIAPPVFFEVFQNRFETTGALFPPHAGQQMHKGIEVLNMSSITIGSTVNSQANEFRNMDYGVHINNGNVRLYNNTFFSIQTVPSSFVCPSCICPGGTAVCGIRSGFSGIVPLPIQVGDLNVGNVFRANRFVNSKYGVFTRGNYDVGIRNNNFAFVAYCAELNSSNSRIITIRDNTFGNFNVANGLFNVPNSNITISNNVYTNGSGFVFPFVGNTAVYINHNLIQPFTAKIENNTISRVRQGIYIINANGLTFSGTPKILIRSNTINFNQLTGSAQPGVFHSGIRLESCYQVNVWTNSISKPGANPGLGMVGNLRGVHVSQSPLTVVFKNEFVRMAEGVWTFGNCYPSFFNCNTHRQNYYGYNFAGPADIGNQTGAFPNEIPTGNRWIAPVSSNGDLFGQIAHITPNTPINWWYKAGAFTFPQSGNLPFNSLSGGVNLNEAILTTNNDVCGPLPINPPIIDKREWQLGKIIRQEKDSSILEFGYFDKRSAIMQLKEAPSLLNLGTSDDTLYQNFLLQNAYLPGGRLDQVNRYLASEDTSAAIAENNQVNTQMYWEERIKRANAIILSAISTDSLSVNDSTELWNLAFENSLYSGPGVFSARAFFRLDISDDVNGEVRSNHETLMDVDEEMESLFNVYPNPTRDVIEIELKDYDSDNFRISIYDIKGKLIYTDERKITEVLQMNLKNMLSPGIYFLEVGGEFNVFDRVKIVLLD